MKILAIGDKPDNLTTLSAVVRDTLPKTLVMTATNGPAGIKLAAAEDPDVILLDIVMPGMDGFEVCRQLKADDRIKDIPVVFLTALKTDTASRVKALEAGGEGFLAKPLETAELTAQIRTMTKVKAANRSLRTEKTRLEALVAERTADLHGTLAAMRESEERYRGLLENLDAGVVVHAPDTSIIMHNSRASELLGLSHEQMRGKLAIDPAWHFINEHGKPYFIDDYPVHQIVSKRQAVKDIILGINRPATHDVVWVSVNGVPVLDCKGELSEIVISFIDITERKQAEEAQRTAERNLRSTVDGLSAHIAVLDEHGEIILTNKSYSDFAKQNGIEPNTVSEGTNYLAFCDPASGEHSEEAKPFAEGIRKVLSGNLQSFELEYPCHSPDEKRWFVGRVTPFAGEGPRRVIVAHENITERKQVEGALKQSEELLLETERIGKVGGWSFNIDTMAQTWTPEVYRIHEIEISPNPTVEAGINYYTKASRPIIEKAVQRAIELGEDFDLELEIITAKGNTRAVHTIGKADLQNRRIYGFFQDITERKQAGEAVRREQVFSKALIDSIPGTFYVLDERGGYVRWNAYQRDEIVGRSEKETAGFSAIDTIHPDDREMIGARIANVLKNGTVETVEGRVLLRGGPAFRWLLMTGRRMAIDGKTFLVGIGIDITERKQAEEALLASEDKFRSIFASMTEMVVLHELVCDEDAGPVNYRILDCNPAFTRITGIRHEDAVGRLATDVYGSDSAPYLDEYARVALTGAPCTFIAAYAPMDKHFDLHAASPGKNMFFTVTTDITERKRAETYREMGQEILEILNKPGDLQESIQSIITALKTRTGCDAVGLHLQEGEDFPYFVQDGFSEDFLLTENTLVERGRDGGVCRDKDGNICLECTCGLVISGKTDHANPLFTKGGSCWTNDSFPLLDLPADQDPRLHPRNNCIHQGYASVALIPIRTPDRIVGLIQLNDKRKGRFALQTIEILEGIAAHIGAALMRKRAEAELRESEAKFRTMVETFPLAIHQTVGVEQITEYVNPTMVKLFGYTQADIPSVAQWWPLAYPDETYRRQIAEEWTKRVKHAIATQSQIDPMEVVCTCKDGSKKNISWGYITLGDKNYSLGLDLTERKQAEAEHKKLESQLRQAQKMESVGRLAGGVAHDFNNMLTIIIGHAEMILARMTPAQPFHAELTEIRNAGERSADLTRQLLAFARKQTIAPKVLDLNEAAAGMLKMLQRLIGDDIEFIWSPGKDLWPVKMDPSQLDQILANLCVNARDAITDVGKVTIETGNTVFAEADCVGHPGFVPGEYVRIAVSDNGCGMDSATMESIFEPFFTTKATGEGTGLGLATVYGAVTQNHGFIKVDSEPGRGTTLSIYLPRHIAGKSGGLACVAGAESPEGAPASVVPGHETILLVEDEPSILEMTKMILEGLGYSVVTAGTPGEAVCLAQEHAGDIHLLMTDVVMPEMNGRALAKNLLSLYPELRCLFMSGYTADVIAHHGVLESDMHFIQKPFTINGLSTEIRKALNAGRA